MKSFSMKDGDVIVAKTIEMCSDAELLRQKVERVLATNQGEWSYDTKEGIHFPTVLRKNYNENDIRATIEHALLKVDETFTLLEFSMGVVKRKASIKIKAVNADGVEVEGVYPIANY